MNEIELVATLATTSGRVVLIRRDDIKKIVRPDVPFKDMSKRYTIFLKSGINFLRDSLVIVEIKPGIFKSGSVHVVIGTNNSWFGFVEDEE